MWLTERAGGNCLAYIALRLCKRSKLGEGHGTLLATILATSWESRMISFKKLKKKEK